MTYWLRRAWLREIDGKIPTDSLCRFCRAHSDQIPYGKLDEESREWLRSMGFLWLAEPEQGHEPTQADGQDCRAGLIVSDRAVNPRPNDAMAQRLGEQESLTMEPCSRDPQVASGPLPNRVGRKECAMAT